MNSKSQSIHQIRATATHQSPTLKKNRTNENDILQSDDVMIFSMIVRNFQIDPQKFDKFAALEVFFQTLKKLKRSTKRTMTILITIKSPSLINSKLLLEK